MALTHTPKAHIGLPCPDFQLLGVDGKKYSLKDFSGQKCLLIMFICNHCPYVQAVEDRIVSLARYIKNNGGEVVGISSNDADRYPEDNFENMKKRSKEKSYPFAYLYDETQDVAKAFDAVCTPDFFLYDSSLKLQYRGRLDDSWKDPSLVTKEELKAAATALLQGEPVNPNQQSSMGCSIKWK